MALRRIASALALAAVAVAGCSQGVAGSPSSTLAADRKTYLAALQQQNVRYHTESEAFAMASTVCAALVEAHFEITPRLAEMWAAGAVRLQHQMSDRDAQIIVTATEHSKLC